MSNVHNRISLDRFFEVGGICRIWYHSGKVGEVSKFASPRTVEEFNSIMAEALYQHNDFRWNGWEYRPEVHKNEQGEYEFYYLIATNKLA